MMIRSLRTTISGGLALALLASVATAAPPKQRKPDLGDVAQGTYFGDVISDSQGSSRSGVTLSVTRVGPNRVQVTSDYSRLPTITVGLTRAMDKIVQASGNSVFLLDPAKSPPGLDVSFNNEVSWSGSRQ